MLALLHRETLQLASPIHDKKGMTGFNREDEL